MTSNRRPLVIGIGAVVLALLVFVALVKPKTAKLSDLKTQVDQANSQTQQLQVQISELADARRQAPEVKKELARLEALIPATTDEPGMLRRLKRSADRSAIELTSIGSGQPTTAGPYSTIPVDIEVSGSYFAMQEYLFRLETFARAVKVTNLQLVPSSWPTLQVKITANFFTIDTSAGPGSEPGSQSVAG
jgi:Tfp pilus assembly protein PilO